MPEPGNPQALNRYSYGLNRPTVLIDPTGHVAHPNCQGSGAAIADCGVDGWFGYEDYAVRKQLREIGQREGDKVARALLDVVTVLFEPADYAATIGACLSGDCSVLALGAMALPIVPGAIGRNADEVFAGVRQASAHLRTEGVPRSARKQILESFDVETIRVRTAGTEEYGVRYYDRVSAMEKGRYLFETFPASRDSLAVMPEWNSMAYFKQWQIRPGTTVIEGRAASQGQLHGGQIQKFILYLKDLLP